MDILDAGCHNDRSFILIKEEKWESNHPQEENQNWKFSLKNSPAVPTRKDHEFKCSFCQKTLRSKNNLLTHLRIHTGERPFLCKTCGRSFSCLSNSRRHERTHTNPPEGKYRCKFCRSVFTSASNLANHMGNHSEAKPAFECEICRKYFLRRDTFENHKKIHLKHNPVFECEECDKVFLRKDSYVIHRRFHSNERPFPCDLCSESFTSSSTLKKHAKRRHTFSDSCDSFIPRSQAFSCETCDKDFSTLSYLKKHLCSHQGSTFVCSICGQSFPFESNLMRHQAIHTGEKIYKCEQCNKSFNRSDILKDHLSTHGEEEEEGLRYLTANGVKPKEVIEILEAACHDDKSFILSKEERDSLNLVPFICSYCVESFWRKDQLKRHIKHHLVDSVPD